MLRKEILSYDKDSNEADILFSLDIGNLIVYAANYKENNSGEFVAFLPTNIMKTDDEPKIQKTDDSYYSYRIVGTLIDKDKVFGTLKIGDFSIKVEYIPKDIQINENISFNCVRVDYISKSCENDLRT